MRVLNHLVIATAFLASQISLAADNTAYARALVGFTQDGVIRGSLAEKWESSSHHLSTARRQVIRDFSATSLTKASQLSETVFYPFGGPDAIYPHLFFPHMKTLILVGLEHVGVLPDLSDKSHYGQLREIMGTLFDHTFYHTKKMSKERAQSPANANLTKVLASLALLGAEIDGISLLRWNAEGNLEVIADAPGARIARIDYRLEDNHPRQVYYFQQNLGDSAHGELPGLKSAASQPFVKFLQRHRGYTSFYKAASFLSHESYFSYINELNLKLSNYVVQTDTGIPYKKLYGSENWDIALFGVYKWPKEPFKGSYQQSDLMQDCAASASRLPFSYCYNFGIGGSHLIYAVKKIPLAQPVE